MSTPTTLSVSQITHLIKNQLEQQFRGLLVQGEISNCKLHSAGHIYFDLKDANARVSCVMFRADNSCLSRAPKDGDQVVVKGSVTVYAPQGKYQMVIKELQYAGVGELLLKLHELKIKLNALGWFAQEHKKKLPAFPKVIGVVTSPTGAVIRDIINVLSRRFSGFHLILNPVKVQGVDAATEIAQAIDQFNQFQLADVLIVGRGGGSLEDLWAFNEEIVAQAIFKSTIPIISAVGHETDVCIADFVADVRAPTPSAAAEMVIAEKAHQIQFLFKTKQLLHQSITQKIKRHRQQLQTLLKQPIFLSPFTILGRYVQQLNFIEQQIEEKMIDTIRQKKLILISLKKQIALVNPTVQLNNLRAILEQKQKNLYQSMRYQLHTYKMRLNRLHTQLESLNPKKVLQRGYSILFAENENSVIVSVKELNPAQNISALLSDGKVEMTVNNIIPLIQHDQRK